ncbi:MAG TPA: hypothetical protein VGF04_05420 [Solirubrobacterales bacterium]
MDLSGGNRRHRRRPRAAVAVGILAAAAALPLGACGSESSSDANETAGTYRVKVVKSEFPAKQQLGETTLMRIGVRNTGERTVPALTVTVSLAGKEGKGAALPFAIRDPQPGLAAPDRPVWVLAEHYPKLNGSSKPGGAETTGLNTYNLGPLDPGKTTEAVWKLSASRTGRYTVQYGVDAGLGGKAKAETASGVAPGGTFIATIASTVPPTTVNDQGEVVEVGKKRARYGGGE